MEKDHNIGRRKLLRNIGASSAGIAFVGTSAAAADGVDRDAVIRALETERMQDLLRTLGHPFPERTDSPAYERAGPMKLSLDEASFVDSPGADTKIDVLKIPTDIGVLAAGIVDDTVATAQFHFDDLAHSDQQQFSHLWENVGYESGTSAFLLTTDDDVRFGRTATDAERAQLDGLLPETEFTAVGAFESETEHGFRVNHRKGSVLVDTDLSTVVSRETAGSNDGVSTEGAAEDFVECAGYDLPGCVSDIGTTYASCETAGTACAISVSTGPYGWAACAAVFTLICAPAIALHGLSNSCSNTFDCAMKHT